MEKIEHKTGTICYRCGNEKPFVRRERVGCNTGYAYYHSHLWNKEPMTVETYFLTPTTKK